MFVQFILILIFHLDNFYYCDWRYACAFFCWCEPPAPACDAYLFCWFACYCLWINDGICVIISVDWPDGPCPAKNLWPCPCVLIIGMLWCSFIVGCWDNFVDRPTPDGPLSPIGRPPRFCPIPLYPIKFYYEMSLNCLWWFVAPKLWCANFYSCDCFLLPRLPPDCFLEPVPEPFEPPVLLRPPEFQLIVLSVECYLLEFGLPEPPSSPPLPLDPDFACFWLYIFEVCAPPISLPFCTNIFDWAPG